MIVTIILSVSGLVVAFCAFMLVRNEWVYRQRGKFIDEVFDLPAMHWWEIGRPGLDDVCVSYDAMMRRFWVWDREAFRIKHLPPPANLDRINP